MTSIYCVPADNKKCIEPQLILNSPINGGKKKVSKHKKTVKKHERS